jgi:hypothetical protein
MIFRKEEKSIEPNIIGARVAEVMKALDLVQDKKKDGKKPRSLIKNLIGNQRFIKLI